MRYRVEILGTLIKDTKVCLYGTNFWNKKKSARFARTFSSRASRAARFARKTERAYGARPDGRRASRSDVYELRAMRSVLRAS